MIVALLAVGASTGAGRASAPALVADVETGVASRRGVSAYDFAEMDGVLYYAASDLEHGFELWRTDGTSEGTYVVADIQPGPVGSMPRHLTPLGSTLFFVASDGRSGFGLWKSDGTGAGTRLVKGVEGDFRFPGQLTAFGSTLLLTAGSRSEPRLWRSDGTPEGTEMVRELWEPGDGIPAFAEPRLPGAILDSTAYFMTRVDGRRVLWRTDGSAAGTSRVWVSPVPLPAPPDGQLWVYYDLYASVGDYLLFRGQDEHHDGLWRSDGTAAGTYPLATAAPGEYLAPDWFTPLGTTVLFAAGAVPYAFAGLNQVWRTDGTPAGTSRVLDLGLDTVREIVAAGGHGFVATALFGIGITDGTGPGTRWLGPLKNAALASTGERVFFATGVGTLGVIESPGGDAVVLRDGFLEMGAGATYTSSAHVSLWPLGLRTLITTLGDSAYLRAAHGAERLTPLNTRRDELWRSDGTTAGTLPVLAHAGRTRGSWPDQFVGDEAAVYFGTGARDELAPDVTASVRLMRVDPFTGAVAPVKTWTIGISEGPCLGFAFGQTDCRLRHLTQAGGRLFFMRIHRAAAELWTSDGTPEGTVMLYQELAWPPVMTQAGVGAISRRLVFLREGQLWASDGTPAGTIPIGFPSGPVGAGDLQFTPAGATLFFATAAGSQSALYRTDGKPGSVQLVKSVAAAELTDVAGTLYFTSNGELWKSDGTGAGTVRVGATQYATRLTAVGTRVFFTESDAAHGTELWVSDGTGPGTHLVADLRAGPQSSEPDGLTAEGDRLFFSANDGVGGREPWVTDGTPEGTLPLADIHPGPASGLAEGPILAAGGGRVYFPAFTPSTGLELWSSDGTSQGTAPVQDIAPGAASSDPRELAAVGGRLYFSADDGMHGQEPWSLPLPAGAEKRERNPQAPHARRLARSRIGGSA